MINIGGPKNLWNVRPRACDENIANPLETRPSPYVLPRWTWSFWMLFRFMLVFIVRQHAPRCWR